MKILRWLLCHSLTITLVVAIVLLYAYRQPLLADLKSQLGIATTNQRVSVEQRDMRPSPPEVVAEEPPVPVTAAPPVLQQTDTGPVMQQPETADRRDYPAWQPVTEARRPTMPGQDALPAEADPWASVLDKSGSSAPGSTEMAAWPQEAVSTVKPGTPRRPASDSFSEQAAPRFGTEPDEIPAATGMAVMRDTGETGFPPLGYDPEAPDAESSVASAALDEAPDSTGLSWQGAPEQPRFPGDEEVAGVAAPDTLSAGPDEAVTAQNPTAITGFPPEQALTTSVDRVPAAVASRQDAATGMPVAGDYPTRLEVARRQYWEGQMEQAQDSYQRLVEDFPDRADAATELGNLLLQSGDESAATTAYSLAIPRLINLQRGDEAINLIRFISRYNPVVADALYKKYWPAR